MAYASHAHKDIFNVHLLDLLKVARSFGFETPPSINLSTLEARGIGARLTTALQTWTRWAA